MSFILDALKKSESERHRHSGPVLMDVRIAPPRRRVPVWAWVIAAVLVVNLVVLAWALWRAPEKAEVEGGTAPAALPPPAAIAPAAPPSAAALPASPLPEPTLSPAAPSMPAQPPSQGPSAPLPAPQNAQPPAAATPDIDITTLPKVQDLLAAGVTLPQLTLSLHVYDPQPANRYVLLNGKRTREGDFTTDGARIVQITATGVVLEWRGRRMFLSASG
jgi:general secretion pathway protein B